MHLCVNLRSEGESELEKKNGASDDAKSPAMYGSKGCDAKCSSSVYSTLQNLICCQQVNLSTPGTHALANLAFVTLAG